MHDIHLDTDLLDEDIDAELENLNLMLQQHHDFDTSILECAMTLPEFMDSGIGEDTLQQNPSMHKYIHSLIDKNLIEGYDSIPLLATPHDDFTIATIEAAGKDVSEKTKKLRKGLSSKMGKLMGSVKQLLSSKKAIDDEAIDKLLAAIPNMSPNASGSTYNSTELIHVGTVYKEQSIKLDKMLSNSKKHTQNIKDGMSLIELSLYGIGKGANDAKSTSALRKESSNILKAFKATCSASIKACTNSRKDLSAYNASSCNSLCLAMKAMNRTIENVKTEISELNKQALEMIMYCPGGVITNVGVATLKTVGIMDDSIRMRASYIKFLSKASRLLYKIVSSRVNV